MPEPETCLPMSNVPAHILVVDDEPDLRTLYEVSLVREGYQVETAGTVAEALAALDAANFDLVLTDMRLPDGLGVDILGQLTTRGRSERTIVITAYGSAENAVEALKLGAFDYLTKPVDLRQFRSVVASALRGLAPPARAASSSPPSPTGSTLKGMVGHSAVMERLRERVLKVGRTMAPILITGETGTGKELVARSIHEVSPRASGPFVAVNCGAIPEALLESEFFGHRRGSFTGAHEDRQGFFQAARGGTLFLDEVGELPLAMQVKLLRAIQERAVRPVGATAEVATDVRLISATHRDLAGDVHLGRFRHDLYFRLHVVGIHVPALRERLEDLPELCEVLAARVAAEAGVSGRPRWHPSALVRLAGHAFPGNVRELENLLFRALALSGRSELTVQDVEEALADAVPVATARPGPAAGPAPTEFGHPSLEDVERLALSLRLDDRLTLALTRHFYNRTAAGASLGLSLRQMRYRMARLGIRLDDGDDSEAVSPAIQLGP